MCCCINAIGNRRFSSNTLRKLHAKRCYLESLGLAYPSGWMTSDLFAKQ